MGAGIGGGSGQLETIEGPGRCSRRCSGGQAEMGEDLGDHGGMLDGGDDLQGAAAQGAVFHIDRENSFEQPGPLIGAGAARGGTSAWSAEGVLALTGTFGMMSGCSLALGAKALPSRRD